MAQEAGNLFYKYIADRVIQYLDEADEEKKKREIQMSAKEQQLDAIDIMAQECPYSTSFNIRSCEYPNCPNFHISSKYNFMCPYEHSETVPFLRYVKECEFGEGYTEFCSDHMGDCNNCHRDFCIPDDGMKCNICDEDMCNHCIKDFNNRPKCKCNIFVCNSCIETEWCNECGEKL